MANNPTPKSATDYTTKAYVDAAVAAQSGGSLPEGWTADNPDPGVLDAGATGILDNIQQVTTFAGARMGPDGIFTQFGDIQQADEAQWGAEFSMPDTDLPALQTYDDDFNTIIFKVFGHIAPTDGALNAGECGLWFDQTNGAAKLMIKAKSANGTVVSGSVDLT